MVAGDLPEDLVRDILSRVTIKSVLRFKCVHSTWNSLLKSSSFVAAHLHQRNSENKAHSRRGGFLLAKYALLDGSKESRLRLLNPQTYNLHQDVQIPFEEHPNWFEVAGSCNGLVCLFASCRGRKQQLCLYNPCLQQHNMIPKSPISISMSHLKSLNGYQQCSFVFGFAYDSMINDYKVVSLVSQGGWKRSRNNNHDYSYSSSKVAEVYTLGTNCWRQVEIPNYGQYSYNNFSGWNNQAVVGGAIHWLASGRNKVPAAPTVGDRILSFDVSSELFRLFWLPAAITNTGEWRGGFEEMRIDVYGDGDWLCLVKFEDLEIPHPHPPQCDIWVMKEYGVDESWTKLHAISNIGICDPANFLGFGINGELVFNHNKYTGLSLLYPDIADDDGQEHYRYKDVYFNQTSIMCRCIPGLVTNFVESLVSPLPRIEVNI